MKTLETLSLLHSLQCSRCGRHHDPFRLQQTSVCCQAPLVAQYDTADVFPLSTEVLPAHSDNMWRYLEMLPVFDVHNIVTLGEGMTPLQTLRHLPGMLGFDRLYWKDESLNPTGSFKARGLSAAVSKAKEFGVESCIVPTAGNAGGALSAYCAAAGIPAVVVMPRHTPKIFKEECWMYGAELVLVDGLINDCAAEAARIREARHCFDVSTFKEPYRLEGKKTMGYEIAEQLQWTLPDVILYPTGGGTGLIGLWKAFREMLALGWIPDKMPRMIAVQAENCQPVVATWNGLQPNAREYNGRPSIANGLAVPRPFAEPLMLDVLTQSHGHCMAVSETEIKQYMQLLARKEGMLAAPEGAALVAALPKLLQEGVIQPDEDILLLNTGSGYKYLENLGIPA
ncbi:threonine synthase [Chitinophaga japonensis]|uniref:Threonine synthase n=1 Tax=Chitinophaga japonensis TaxID=104662 RepID=A0A562T0P8_CHIJA|nr:threonine synthase [Chitinophaga japonensis]TWI86646.1 threonine synthase [Chitinophaga japonensis]